MEMYVHIVCYIMLYVYETNWLQPAVWGEDVGMNN